MENIDYDILSLLEDSVEDCSLNYREARWIGKHPNSLKLQKVPIEEFEQTFDYGLKDITKLDVFNQVVDWKNSSFNNQINRYSSPFMIKSQN